LSVGLYMDHHVPAAITEGLRLRGVDVLTAEADGTRRFEDSALLDRATALGRVLFSQDEDLLIEAASRQENGIPFTGVLYAHQQRVTIGQCVNDLEFLALAGEPEDFVNKVAYLPLKPPTR
jgi:hypothetical protein